MTADPSVCVSCGHPRRRRGTKGWQGGQGRCNSCYAKLPAAQRSAPPPWVDPYELEWLAGEPERRADRARPLAADLVRCVARDDAEGVRVLLGRVRDFQALAVVLAECADPVRTAAVTGVPQLVRGAA